MLVIPAIDIKGGKVVRLSQGAQDMQTVYSKYPLEVAEKWASFGVEMIHIVDLDGAMSGRLVNLPVVSSIARKVKPKIELGGGIRDVVGVKLVLDSGIDKAVIGTRALEKKFLKAVADKFGDKIVAAVDAQDGFVRTMGWTSETKVRTAELIGLIEKAGIRRINYTEITRDGMLEGPDIAGIKKVLAVTGLGLIVAGGISTIDDVRKLKELEVLGLKGMIIGKALYEARIDLAEAVEICSQKE